MSLPGSNSSGAGRDDEAKTIMTIMMAVAAIFMIAGTIILSKPLYEFYGKFFWEVGSK